MLAKIWAIAKKDLRVFVADRKAMMISFIVPIAIASFFSMIMGGGGAGTSPASKIKMAVVDLDQTPLTKSIIEKLKKSDSVEPVAMEDEAAHDAVLKGDISVGVSFPKGFADEAKRAAFYGDRPKVDLFYDPSQSVNKQVANGALMQYAMAEIMRSSFSGEDSAKLFDDALAKETDPKKKTALEGLKTSLDQFRGAGFSTDSATDSGGAGMRQPYEVVEKPLTASKDPDAEKKATLRHIFAGMAVQGVLFFGIEAAMSILRERKTGLWGRLRAAPVAISTLVCGRGLGSWLIAMMIMTGVFLFGIVVLGVRIDGSMLGFFGILAMTALMTACFGLFVASLGKTEAQARGFSILAVLMMSMLGGAWFPTFLMPKWVQTFSLVVPVRWAVDGFDAVTWRGTGLIGVSGSMLGLLGFSVLFASIAMARMRKL